MTSPPQAQKQALTEKVTCEIDSFGNHIPSKLTILREAHGNGNVALAGASACAVDPGVRFCEENEKLFALQTVKYLRKCGI